MFSGLISERARLSHKGPERVEGLADGRELLDPGTRGRIITRMRPHTLSALLVLSSLTACSGDDGPSANMSFGSREQIRYIAQCEGRLTKVERAVRDFQEGYKFLTANPNPARKQAMDAAGEKAKAARQKLDQLKSSGSSAMATSPKEVDEAIAAAETALAAVPPQ